MCVFLFLSPPRDQSGRVLCGVMRIGLVAKGLLIKDDMDLELVLMCKEKPTETLLSLVKDNLPIQIQVSPIGTLTCCPQEKQASETTASLQRRLTLGLGGHTC